MRDILEISKPLFYLQTKVLNFEREASVACIHRASSNCKLISYTYFDYMQTYKQSSLSVVDYTLYNDLRVKQLELRADKKVRRKHYINSVKYTILNPYII